MEKRAVVVVTDLLFQPRIQSVLETMGFDVALADVPPGAPAGGAWKLAVIDLQAAGFDAAAEVRAAKDGGAAVLAFGKHTEPAAMRAAREAGADMVVPRSQLVDELPQLVERLVADSIGQ